MTKLGLYLGLAALPLFASLVPADAYACGGCFHPENQPPEQASVVLAHRMALSISPDVSVLWDQVQYAGEPAEFAWVLPVKPGARLEVASDAWFEALDAATTVRVVPPTIQCVTTTTQQVPTTNYSYVGCSGGAMSAGCAGDAVATMGTETTEVTEVTELAPPANPVTVVHQGSAGPYETVTLHSDVPGALPQWLTDHGYAIDADIQPIIDAYATEGFDFIALRLLPDKGVQQMKPVRVIQPGAVTALPLRMVAAGAGANVSLTLFVIAEGQYVPENFSMAPRPDLVTWDFGQQQSDYVPQREARLAGQAAWMTAFSVSGALFTPSLDPTTGGYVQYATGLGVRTTIADAFMDQALSNGEAEISCAGIYGTLSQSGDKVVDTCPPEGGECADPAPDELDARYFECGPIKDLAVALVGQHPRDVWVTRLEAELPRGALANDLQLTPSYLQSQISNAILATNYNNPPCQVASAAAMKGGPKRRDGRWMLGGAGLVVLAFTAARRLGRRARPAMARAR
jgi:hypothetical protein